MNSNWNTSLLGEVCSFENGDRGSNYPSKKYRSLAGIPFINAGHLTKDGIDMAEMDYISQQRFDLLGSGKARKGDILFCLRGSLGKFSMLTKIEVAAIASSLIIIRPTNTITSKFLLLYLDSDLCKKSIKDFSNGTAQPNLSAKSLKKFKIPIPPISEQKRIVRILDEALSSIGKAEHDVEKNLQNSKKLFESFLNTVFSQNIPDWVESDLKKVTIKIGSGSTPKGGKESYHEQGISLIRSLNVYDEGFRVRKLAYLDDDQATLLQGVTVQKSDVLFNITGASIARCCIVPDNILPARVNQHVCIIRPNQEKISSQFLHYVLTAKTNKDKLLATGSKGGSTRQAVTKRQLEGFKILFPKSLNKQVEIVEKINRLSNETKKLEEIYMQKLALLDELKKSLLHQAFTGQL